jgi:hypothetical protein
MATKKVGGVSYNYVPGTDAGEELLGTPNTLGTDGTPIKVADYIDAKGGNDELHGRWGNDYLNAGAGHDSLWGDAGNDIETGGQGNDRFYFAWDTGNDQITDFNVQGVNHRSETDTIQINSMLVSNQAIYDLIAGVDGDKDTLNEYETLVFQEWLDSDKNGAWEQSGYTEFETQRDWEVADVNLDGKSDAILQLYSNEWVELANDTNWRGVNPSLTDLDSAYTYTGDNMASVVFLGWGDKVGSLESTISQQQAVDQTPYLFL